MIDICELAQHKLDKSSYILTWDYESAINRIKQVGTAKPS
jgi:hypothetical protein